MSKLSINDLDLKGKRVFIRVDFNVPLKDAVVTDDTRIRETLPTIRLALQKGGRLVLGSHLGRPKGGPDPQYSLRPAAKKLEELLGRPVAFIPKKKRTTRLFLSSLPLSAMELSFAMLSALRIGPTLRLSALRALCNKLPLVCSWKESSSILAKRSRIQPAPSLPFWVARKLATKSKSSKT
jgi:hypothetical protein